MTETYGQAWRAAARYMVENGGGVWVGVQEIEGMPYSLVLFNSPKTGSTLALKTSDITPIRVREHIAASDALFTTQRSSILSVQEKQNV